MKLTLPLIALATFAFALFSSASATGRARPSCRDKNGACVTSSGNKGFYFNVGSRKLCVPDGWACGKFGIQCRNRPSEDFCPSGYGWLEWEKHSWKGCVPTSGDNDDDDDDPDCSEGASWKDGRCVAGPPTPSTCPPNAWWWSQGSRCGKATSNRCIPSTQPSKAVTPPEKTKCCPQNWRWQSYGSKKICVPNSPKLPSCKGQPACPTTHWWDRDNGCCTKHTAKRALSPSGDVLPLSAPDALLCPNGLASCPIAGVEGAWECLDPATELESCGGCASVGRGEDCTAIKGAGSVGCERGRCKVYTCASGLLHNNSCIQ